jgi:hypothetical protein
VISRFPPGFLAIPLVLIPACSRPDGPVPAGPSFDLLTDPAVSGSVVDVNGGSICNTFGDGSTMLVRLISVERQLFVGSQNLVCPTNVYSFTPVEPGSYLLRVQIGTVEALDNGFPWRSIGLPSPFEVSDGAVARDVVIGPGIALGGGVFLDGQPIQGIPLTLFYADAFFGITTATTGADGRWAEFLGRDNTLLQGGVRMASSVVCEVLGGRLLSRPSFDPFLFPDELSDQTCTLTESAATAFSHDRTRLVVTPGVGDIGAGQLAFTDGIGNGWGVQFPVNPGEHPRHRDITGSQLFAGGLIVAIRPDRILSANELNGFIQCGNCRVFGPDGRLHYNSSPKFGKKVTWQYSDASSPLGVGLKVVQKSYDGVPPADYVLFRFTITNGGVGPQTIYPGFFGDWDIDDDFLDDVGTTEGRLMYMTNAGGGTAAGSLIVSDAPVSGTTFFTEFGQTTDELVSAMAGDFTNPSVDEPNDHRYVQAIGPITLASGAAMQFWIAIVAGEDVDQLRSNAAAAAADIAQRGAQPDVTDGGGVTASPQGGIGGGKGKPRSALSPTCKRGCSSLQ